MAGKLVHVEIGAEDADRAQGFYSGVFGWEVGPPMSPEMDYRMAQIDDKSGAAIGAGGNAKAHPNVYLQTDDIDASIAKVRELGGKAEDKMPIPHVGWFSRCEDTEGNTFSFFQSDESVPAPSA